MSLHYDFHHLPDLTDANWQQAVGAWQQVHARQSHGELGFAKLPYQDISEISSLAAAVRSEVEVVIVIGIGGSDLGARAVHRALHHQFYNQLSAEKRGGPRLYFLGDTTDPVAIQEVLDVVDVQKTAVVLISKSGNTIEQMSTFIYLQSLLRQAVGDEQLVQRIIMITDAETGTLREIVKQDGYRSLVVPGDVGGRFSVLATVGLFVLAVTGVDIASLLAGAAWFAESTAQDAATDPSLFFAIQQYVANTERQQPISVLMPYSYNLREVGFWYRQLWAESLGKKLNREGQTVEVGPTPIAAVGPTDQHSQLQLYREGPRDKMLTFIGVENVATDMTLPAAYPALEGVSYLAGHTFSEIIHAELESTALALAEDGRPSATITISNVDAFHIGALLYFFEQAVAYSGEFYNIDAYNQPGVELSKNIMYGLLHRPGYEEKTIATPPAEKVIRLVRQ